ncbi:MAG: efflux RND transporter periplasmic adaptor subunit [Desulfobacterales bacterium]|nr:efflux RND transporter periplasmic adaptor subunit [Desulfobacterales bacterium]
MKNKYIISTLLIGFYVIIFAVQTAFAEQFPVVVEAEVRAILSAEREGVLSSLKVDTGDWVKKGTTLAVVFHKNIILKKEQHEARRKYLAIQVENLTKLNEKNLVTHEELARAKMEQVVNAKEITIDETLIKRSKIRAPFSGTVVSRHIQPHEWVKPGQPVVELYNPGRLRIVADIPSDIAVGLKKGQIHTLFFPDLNQQVKAKIKVFSPQVDVRSNTIKVYWRVYSEKKKKTKVRLLPGMKGVLKIGGSEDSL